MNFIGCVLMAGITFPVSYYLARGCLRGVLRAFGMRQVSGPPRRSVL